MANEKSLEQLKLELAQMEAKMEKEDRANDRKMKKEGYTHRVDAWIHPEYGDDRMSGMYTKGQPTKAQLARLLRSSVVKTDYRIIKL